MSRLPIPGQDDGTWGGILNDYLSQSINADGSLKTSAVAASGAEETTNKGQANGYAGLDGGSKVPLVQLGGSGADSTKFLRGDQSWVTPPSAADATTSSKGIVELNGDLAGTASSPIVQGIQGHFIAPTTPSNNQVLTYDGTNTEWKPQTPPSAPVTTVFSRTGTVTAQSGDYTFDQVGAAQGLVATSVKTISYSANPGDFVPVDTSSVPVTVNLPSAPADKTRIGVKLIALTGSNAVTVAAGGSDVFNKAAGSTSLTLSMLNQGVLLQYASSSGIWYVQADDLALTQLDARYAIYVNVATFGAVGNGSTDDSAAIQSAINVAGVGGTVFFPRPSKYYSVASTLTLPNHVRLLGTHSTGFTPNTAPYSAQMQGCVIKMANGANLDAVIASQSWYNNTPGSGINLNQEIDHLIIDGNAANQTSGQGIGIALSCYRARVRDSVVFNTAGDGILLTNEGRVSGQASEYPSVGVLYTQAGTGTTLGQGNWLSGSIVECYFERNLLAYNGVANGAGTPSPGANAFQIWENPTHRGLIDDGYFTYNVIQNAGFDGLHMWQGGDWVVEHNHLYGCGYSDLWMFFAGITSICNNFFEHPGLIASGVNIYSIRVAMNSNTGCIIQGNRIYLQQPLPSSGNGSGNTYYGIAVTNASGSGNVNWTANIINNFFGMGGTGSTFGTAIWLDNTASVGQTNAGSALIAKNSVDPRWATGVLTTGTWNLPTSLNDTVPISISGNTTLTNGATYLCTATLTATLPAPVNGGQVAAINTGSGTVTVATPSGSIIGSSSLAASTSGIYISDGTNWIESSGISTGATAATAGFNVVTKTNTNYTAANGDFVLVSASTTNVTITSPSATANGVVSIKKTDSSTNTVTFSPASGTVDGAASFVLTNQYDQFRFIADGTNWWIF